MSWLSAAPAVALAAFWAVAPGLLAGWAWGLRGLTAWGAAPLLSVAVVAISAVVAGAVGLPWGPWVALVAAALAALAALGARAALDAFLPKYRTRPPESTLVALRDRARALYVRLRTPSGAFARLPDSVEAVPTSAVPVTSWPTTPQRNGTDGRWAVPAALVGTVAAALLGWLSAAAGMGGADALSQTYDAVFHYSAVAHIVGTGDASSLTIGTLTQPEASTAFYPAAWHDLVALASLSSGTGVITSANATALVVAALVWPLGCLLLARHVLGPSAGVALATPVLAVGFTAFPWNLMSFGVLWPNLLGVALLPAALAATLPLLGLARDPVIGRSGSAALLAIALPTLGLAHPNTVFSLAVLALFPILVGLGTLFRRRLRTPQWWQPVGAAVATVVLAGFGTWLITASPLTAGVRSFDWDAFQTTGESVWAVLTNSTNLRPEAWTISLLVLVGAVFALRAAATAWLVPAHVASGFLYLQAASQESAFTTAVTGAWYNDSYRLAAMLPITGVPLAALAVLGIAGLLRRAAQARIPAVARWRRGLPATAVAAVTTLSAVVSGGMDRTTHADALATTYQRSPEVLLEPGQREFLRRIGDQLPPDAVVAENPYAGNALLYPLTGREVLFPHLSGNWAPDQVTIAARLRHAAADPDVCDAIAATRIDYVLSGPVTFWAWDGRSTHYPGLDGLDGFPGFEFVDTDGRNTLYRITACGTNDVSNS